MRLNAVMILSSFLCQSDSDVVIFAAVDAPPVFDKFDATPQKIFCGVIIREDHIKIVSPKFPRMWKAYLEKQEVHFPAGRYRCLFVYKPKKSKDGKYSVLLTQVPSSKSH